MDELTLLRKARSNIAAPSEAALTRGRAELFEKISAETHPAAASVSAGKSKAIRRISWASAGVLVAGALATTLALTNVLGFAGWRGGADPAAADVLNSAALATIETSDPVVANGQYLRVDTSAVYGATSVDEEGRAVSYLTINTDQLYVPSDRGGDWVWKRSLSKPHQFFGKESERVAWESYNSVVKEHGDDGELLQAPKGSFYGTPSPVSPSALADLPEDPHQLLNHIYRITLGQGNSPDGEALVFIADLLRSGVVPAEQRAALYRAAALIPGIEIVEEQATLDGRTGIAIGRYESADKTRQDIIIDPGTGHLIGERRVQLEADWGYPAGTATAWTAVTTSVVDAAPTGGTPNGAMDEMGCTSTSPGSFQC
ncbi:MAG TPA: CU044_5270 family protein [Glaciibacter sp.]|nr:CU044_5270 family protein [Glaciibacter sp.]